MAQENNSPLFLHSSPTVDHPTRILGNRVAHIVEVSQRMSSLSLAADHFISANRDAFLGLIGSQVAVIRARSQNFADGEVTVFDKALLVLTEHPNSLLAPAAVNFYCKEYLNISLSEATEVPRALEAVAGIPEGLKRAAVAESKHSPLPAIDPGVRRATMEPRLASLWGVYESARVDYLAGLAGTARDEDKMKAAMFLRDTAENILQYLQDKADDPLITSELKATFQHAKTTVTSFRGGIERKFDVVAPGTVSGSTRSLKRLGTRDIGVAVTPEIGAARTPQQVMTQGSAHHSSTNQPQQGVGFGLNMPRAVGGQTGASYCLGITIPVSSSLNQPRRDANESREGRTRQDFNLTHTPTSDLGRRGFSDSYSGTGANTQPLGARQDSQHEESEEYDHRHDFHTYNPEYEWIRTSAAAAGGAAYHIPPSGAGQATRPAERGRQRDYRPDPESYEDRNYDRLPDYRNIRDSYRPERQQRQRSTSPERDASTFPRYDHGHYRSRRDGSRSHAHPRPRSPPPNRDSWNDTHRDIDRAFPTSYTRELRESRRQQEQEDSSRHRRDDFADVEMRYEDDQAHAPVTDRRLIPSHGHSGSPYGYSGPREVDSYARARDNNNNIRESHFSRLSYSRDRQHHHSHRQRRHHSHHREVENDSPRHSGARGEDLFDAPTRD